MIMQRNVCDRKSPSSQEKPEKLLVIQLTTPTVHSLTHDVK